MSERLIFGDEKQIKKIKYYQKVMAGEINFHELDYEFCHYWGATTDTGKPKYKLVEPEKADAVVDLVPCPQCERLHCLLVTFDPEDLPYDQIISVDKHLEQEGFSCWNCELEFEVKDRAVFVKQETEEV